ncbi:hypothetical protein D3C80_1262350 [compost metagenome]
MNGFPGKVTGKLRNSFIVPDNGNRFVVFPHVFNHIENLPVGTEIEFFTELETELFCQMLTNNRSRLLRSDSAGANDLSEGNVMCLEVIAENICLRYAFVE